MKREITVAAHASFCFGVKRAVEMLENALELGEKIFCLGEPIHNPSFIRAIRERGVRIISDKDLESLPRDALVFIRAHGIPREQTALLDAKGIKYIDATCPYVKRIHDAVASADDGTYTVILGDRKHPEVSGIMSHSRGPVFVYGSFEEAESRAAEDIPVGSPVIAVAQTTFATAEWKKFCEFFKKVYTNAKIFDTICRVTEERQAEILELAEKNDGVIVVGGKNSSNTQKLYALASSVCPLVLHIEDAQHITKQEIEAFSKCEKIVIAAGASTPPGIIQEVKKLMAENMKEEFSFEELLDQSFKTLNTGERVTGVILAVNPAEIKVDLGTKHTGILPYDEITTESGVVLEDEFHVGDTIDVICTKFNDVEGTVMLSKKRLDVSKHLAELQSAVESGETLYGTVKEITRGGVVVQVKTATVFVPASQCGLPKDADLSELKGKKVPLKIIEYNEQRRRAVGSIRNALRSQHKKEVEEFYATLEPGQKFKGTVRSLTNFGAFVNIGPVDGMVHITELSWGRLKPPSEVLSVGQIVDVYVKSVDPEKKRISLGYKTEENNPWNIFLAKYKEGDIIPVTVVSLMPFGAFAEIIPGVDGLIHNSQISDKPVSNPASVLKAGDKVDVKIIAIDRDKNRISLSIRAALDPDYVAPEPPKAKEKAEESAEENAVDDKAESEVPAEEETVSTGAEE